MKMARKTILGLIWLSFVVYAFFFAPPSQTVGDTFELLTKLSMGQWSSLNPIIVAIFSIMGIMPWVYGAFILFDSPEQSISAYPFFIGSFAFGAFALLPYLILRQRQIIKSFRFFYSSDDFSYCNNCFSGLGNN